MMTSIQVDQDTAEALVAQAAALGVPLDQYVRLLLAQPYRFPAISIEEFERLADELTEDATSSPPLPEDFSRKDIYDDHD